MKYTVINKQLMAVKGNESYTRIEPNIFEAIKAECIADAKGLFGRFLPHFRIRIPDELEDLSAWRCSLTSDNSPALVSFAGRSDELQDAIKDIDLSQPYNEQIAQSIRSKFLVKSHKKADVDADLIIQGELGELDDNQ